MLRRSLVALLILLGGAALLLGGPDTGQPAPAPEFVPARLAPFSAAAAEIRGDTLIVTDLEEVDPRATGRDLAGRVLLGGNGCVKLGLWALKAGANMARATPFLGREGPGARLGDQAPLPSAPGTDFVPFKVPVAITLTDVDADGRPCRPRQVTVRTLRLTADRP